MIRRFVAAFGAFQVKSSTPDPLVKLIIYVNRIVGTSTSGSGITDSGKIVQNEHLFPMKSSGVCYDVVAVS